MYIYESIIYHIRIYVYIYILVGGIPTPLKNDGVRQLGLLFPTEWENMFQSPPTSYLHWLILVKNSFFLVNSFGFAAIFIHGIYIYTTIWLFNIAMENGPFLDDFPIKTSMYKGFSMAMLNNQMVTIYTILYIPNFFFIFSSHQSLVLMLTSINPRNQRNIKALSNDGKNSMGIIGYNNSYISIVMI